jgi:cytidylate kinase
MGTVTIAATYGCSGSVIGPAVAERLGLPFVDRAIPASLAEKISGPLAAALADDTESRTALGRLLNSTLGYSGLFVGIPMAEVERGIVLDVAHTEAALRRAADAGGAVILGRAGVFVLKDRPDCFHVRLDASVEARRRAAMTHELLSYKNAAIKQQETDRARRAYIAHFHPRAGAWEDPSHYHMVLDSTAIPIDTCVEIVTRAAQDVFAKFAASKRRRELGS